MASDELLGQCLRQTPGTQWEDVIGLDAVKQTLLEVVVLPLKFPQLFTGSRRPQFGVLLYGAPGTGKTLLGKALASQTGDAYFFHVQGSDLMSRYIGNNEQLIKALFEKAHQNSPCIILIDDIDLLCSQREEHEWERRFKTEFLLQIDKCYRGNTGIQVVGTTNVPWEINPSVRRCLVKRVVVPLPDLPARSQMFKRMLGDSAHSLTEEDFVDLGKRSEGYTGSDILCTARDAQMIPVREISSATHFKKVTGPSVKDPSVTADDLLTPCSPDDPGAIEMNWTQITEDKLFLQKISMDMMLEALTKSKSTVTDEDLAKIDEFTRDFGPYIAESGNE